MIVVAFTVAHFDGRTMQIADGVEFFEVPSGMSLSPTPKLLAVFTGATEIHAVHDA